MQKINFCDFNLWWNMKMKCLENMKMKCYDNCHEFCTENFQKYSMNLNLGLQFDFIEISEKVWV